jgi:hypothetical protein
MVVRAGLRAARRADVRNVLDTGDVSRVGAVQIAAGIAVLIELEQGAVALHFADESPILFFGAATPVDLFGLSKARYLSDPVAEGS